MLSSVFSPSSNLYDKDAAGCLSGKYMAESANKLVFTDNANLKVSDYIPVAVGSTYYGDKTFNYALFDGNKAYIVGTCTSWTSNSVGITIPSGTAYIRITFYQNNDAELTNRFNKGSLRPFVEGGYNLNIPIYSLPHGRQFEAKLGNNAAFVEAETLTSGDLTLSSFPRSIVKGNRLSFEADITSLTSIRVGKFNLWGGGGGLWDSTYLDIDQTNLVIKQYKDQEYTVYTTAHGLTFSDFIKVVVKQEESNVLIILQTKEDTFTVRPGMYLAFDGTPCVTATNASLSNCKLTAENTDLDSSLWAFGDSYYGIASNLRSMYWLNQWGMANFLIQAYAGQTSNSAYNDLLRLLNFGCPKYIIWSLGMNDDNSSVLSDIAGSAWYSYYTQINDICEDRGIELILTTIPTPKDTNKKNKALINTFIKSSGHRYIDVEKAVGADANGDWYNAGLTNDYQSTDNLHPSEYGAKAIATQFLVDAPEIMQY